MMKVLYFLAFIIFLVNAQQDCETTISKKIEEFKKIPFDIRHEAIQKQYTELSLTYPKVSQDVTKQFIVALFFQENTPASLCKLSQSLFGSMIYHKEEKKPEPVIEKKPEQVVEKKEEHINPRCIYSCLRKKLTPEKWRALWEKCKFDRECWKQNVKEEYQQCATECQSFASHHFGHRGHHKGRHHHHGRVHHRHFHGHHERKHGEKAKRFHDRRPYKLPWLFGKLKEKVWNLFGHKEVRRTEEKVIPAPKIQSYAPIDILTPPQAPLATPKAPEAPKQEQSPRKCMLKCIGKKLSVENFKNLFGKCGINISCYHQELRNEFKGCKSECHTEKPKGGSPVCIFKCFVQKINVEKIKELWGKCKFDRSCWKQNIMNEYRNCRGSCKPKVENSYVRCMMACFRKKLSAVSFRRIYQKCLTDLDCWLDEAPRDFEGCDEECENDVSKIQIVDKECIEKVEKARKHFETLKPEDKIKFAKQIASKLKEKHPNAKEEHIRLFMRLLFSRFSPLRVCQAYKRLFE